MKFLRALFLLFCPLALLGQPVGDYTIGTDPILTNPAFTGAFNRNLIHLNAKRTWTKINQGPSVGYQTHLSKISSGIGINYGHSGFGTSKHRRALVSYAYQFNITDQLTLSAGLSGQVDFFRPNYNFSYFLPACQDCPEIYSTTTLNTGLLLYHQNFFVSVSGHEIRAFDRPLGFKMIYGRRFQINSEKNFELIPNFAFQRQGKENMLELRLNVTYKKLRSMISYGRNLTIGVGLSYDRFDIHYQFIHTEPTQNHSNNINTAYSQLNLQIAIPQQRNRQSNAFDFGVF